MSEPTVYIVRPSGGSVVKIGFTTDLRRRLKAISSANGASLDVLRTMPGSMATERWLHQRFADQHKHHEWFEFSPEMLTVECPEFAPEAPIRPATKAMSNDQKELISRKLRLVTADEPLMLMTDRLQAAATKFGITARQARRIYDLDFKNLPPTLVQAILAFEVPPALDRLGDLEREVAELRRELAALSGALNRLVATTAVPA